MSTAGGDRTQELYEEYCQVPSNRRAEIVNGTLHVLPGLDPRHSLAASALVGALFGPFQRALGGPGGWWMLRGIELHLVPFEPMSPHLAGWRVERMPSLPDTAYFTLPPDWVCEVLSRSTEAVDRNEKLPIYARYGVGHVWLVDPIAKTLEVYLLGDDRRWREVRHYGGDDRVRVAAFEAVEIDLTSLWAPPRG